MLYARRAVEINPNNQWNVTDLGSILTCVSESEEPDLVHTGQKISTHTSTYRGIGAMSLGRT